MKARFDFFGLVSDSAGLMSRIFFYSVIVSSILRDTPIQLILDCETLILLDAPYISG